MKERIIKLLTHFDVNRSQLAQIMGVSKGMVSHLLADNGRGGRFGAVHLENILAEFPSVRREWLFNGEGSMLKSESSKQGSLFEQEPAKESKSPISHEPQAFQVTTIETHVHEVDVNKEPENESQVPRIEEVKTITPSGETKKVEASEIERVLIFYKDGTFSSYLPRT